MTTTPQHSGFRRYFRTVGTAEARPLGRVPGCVLAAMLGIATMAPEAWGAAPMLSPIADQYTWEEEPIRDVPFSVWDPDTPADQLRFATLLAFQDGRGVVDTNAIVVSGTGTNRWLTINPPIDAAGPAQATLTVRDPAGQSTTTRFAVRVHPLNDAPRVFPPPDQDAVAGEPRWGLSFGFADPDTAASGVRLRARSSRQEVLPEARLSILTGSNQTSRILWIDPTNSAPGSTVVTIEADDGQATNTASFILTLHAPEFARASTGQVGSGFEAAWGDFNGDGRMDLVASPTVILTNGGGARFSAGMSIPAVGPMSGGSVADYDKDGGLDLLLVNRLGTPRLFRNGGLGVTNLSLVNVNWGQGRGLAAWADVDRDGDLDVISGGQGVRWARNEGRDQFTDLGTDIPASIAPVLVAVGDYDQDGAADVLAGWTSTSGSVPAPKVYRNVGEGRFLDSGAILPSGGVRSGGFSDLSGDGSPDLWLVLAPSGNRSVEMLAVFVQDQGRFVETLQLVPSGPTRSSLNPAWADFDNDGDMDFVAPWWPVQSGSLQSSNLVVLYRNDGLGRFNVTGRRIATSPGTVLGSVADCDDDGSPDLLMSPSFASGLWILTNAATAPNALPRAPGAPQALVAGRTALLFWSVSIDGNQSAALTYNVRLGTAPGKGDLVAPMSTPVGTRMIPAPGNAGHRLWMTVPLPLERLDTERLYWSVQAVDHGYQGGAFAPEQSFRIDPPGNAPPEIVGVADLRIPEDGIGSLVLEISDDRSPPDTLVVRATCPDTNLLAESNVRLSGFLVTNGLLRVELSLIPTSDRSGRTTVTVSATDRSGATRERQMVVTVTQVNDAPVINAPRRLLALAGSLSPPLAVTASDAESQVAELLLSAVSLSPGIVPDNQITVTRTPAGWEVRAGPLATGPALARIELTVTDPGGRGDSGVVEVYYQRQAFSHVASQPGTTGDAPDHLSWGDLNNDHQLELLAGSVFGPGTTLHSILDGSLPGRAGIPGTVRDLGDIDNDGDVDLLVESEVAVGNASGLRLLVYRNKQGWEFDPLPGLVLDRGAARFVDWDRDGRVDVLVAESAARLVLHRNNGTGFDAGRVLPLSSTPPPEDIASLWLVDLDADGFDEILLNRALAGSASAVYRRAGASLEPLVTNSWTGRILHGVADFNGDEQPDLILTGAVGSGKALWLNRGGLVFEQAALVFSREPSWARVADFDADGFPDAFGFGPEFSGLWCGEPGPSFEEVEVPFADRNVILADAADFDGDGRLEVALGIGARVPGGVAPEVQVHASAGANRNQRPGPPAGLAARGFGTNHVVLSWARAFDPDQTGGLSYNVRVGTSPGAGDVVGPLALSDGWRLLPRVGNAGWRTNLVVMGLEGGRTYYWSVQAVDNAFTGGPFAVESNFTTAALLELMQTEQGGLELRLSAAGGSVWRIEVSNDLSVWRDDPAAVNPVRVPSNGLYRLEIAPGSERQFFRARPLD